MDEFERRLKRDAGNIEAKVSPRLQARIDASLHAAKDSRPIAPAPRRTTSLWWMSSLTGLTAAILIIAFMNLTRDDTGQETTTIPGTVPSAGNSERLFAETFPLDARPAVLTSPLETELENLKSDLEKARESVEEDIKFTF